MDKRLSIALLLTALVVAVTPILFPSPRKASTSLAPGGKDSVAVSAAGPAISGSTVSTTPTAPVTTTTTTSTPPVTASAVALPPADSTPAIPEQVTTVNMPRTTYRFTNVGASPVSITMDDYKNLATKKGQVDLHTTGVKRLLDFAIVAQKDTIKLGQTPFQVTQSPAAHGAQQLTYRGHAAGMGVSISYLIDSARYLVHVSGQLTGAPSPAYLLIGLPSTLPATETDTLVDLRALAFTFKSQRDNARSVPFGKLDPGERKFEPGPLTWAAVKNKYFVVGLINPEGSAFEEMTLVGGTRTTKLATNASATIVKAVKNGAFMFDLYAGPQQSAELLAVGRDFDHVNPYG
ncbi:MAG: membrane protein insertase YidC, partial [Thermoanaerobaculia bacterium]